MNRSEIGQGVLLIMGYALPDFCLYPDKKALDGRRHITQVGKVGLTVQLFTLDWSVAYRGRKPLADGGPDYRYAAPHCLRGAKGEDCPRLPHQPGNAIPVSAKRKKRMIKHAQDLREDL